MSAAKIAANTLSADTRSGMVKQMNSSPATISETEASLFVVRLVSTIAEAMGDGSLITLIRLLASSRADGRTLLSYPDYQLLRPLHVRAMSLLDEYRALSVTARDRADRHPFVAAFVRGVGGTTPPIAH